MSSGIAENAWGSFIPGIAKPDPSAYGGRAVRRGGRYNAFVPPDIATYSFTLGQGTIRDVQVGAGALRQLQKLDLVDVSASTG